MIREESHPLRSWLIKNRITIRDFAEKCGVSRRMIELIMGYKAYPSRRLAKIISDLTGITITVLLYPEFDLSKKDDKKI